MSHADTKWSARPYMSLANARLLAEWPKIVAVSYEGEPEMIAANSGRKSALSFLSLIESTEFIDNLGAPDSLDVVALAYLVRAINAMCAMDRPATRRLIRAAVADMEAGWDDPKARVAEMRRASDRLGWSQS